MAVTLAHHRTTAVALAGVLPFLATGADEAWMQVEAGTQSRPLHLLLAHVVADNRYVHFLQYVLILAIVAESVLAPAGGPASATILRLVKLNLTKSKFACFFCNKRSFKKDIL